VTAIEEEVTLKGWTPTEAVLEAEQAVLGAAIQSREAAEIAAEIVTQGSFFKSLHKVVFGAVSALIDGGQTIDPPAVLLEIQQNRHLLTGGAVELMNLAARAAPSGSVAHHARVVAADHVRRELHQFGLFVTKASSDPGFDIDLDLDMIRKRLDAATAGVTVDEPASAADVLMRVLDKLEQPVNTADLLPPPYRDLEEIVPGLRPGQLVAVGARPAVGKSCVASDFARFTALHLGHPVLFFTLEMTADECMERILAAETGVELSRFQAHALTDYDWVKIGKVHSRIAESQLVIDDSPGCTLARIRSRLRRMARTCPCRLVIIDYLQLMSPPKAESRERAVAEISRGLKLLAMEFRVPILLLAQLNRGPEQRNDKKPVASDFRESGAIEQDIDIALMLYREDATNKESSRAGELDLIVAKHRNGPTGTATVAFQGHYARAVDMHKEPWSPSRGVS
jgi:replicative DNA helicase